MKKFEQGELDTSEQQEINSLILGQASETSEKLTELECKINNIPCWVETEEESHFTEEAQNIFNVYYDQQCEELYSLFNDQLDVLKISEV